MRGWFSGLATWQKLVIGVPAAVLTFLLLVAGVELLASAGRVHPGVRVAGVPVGGLTEARGDRPQWRRSCQLA